MLPDDTEAQDGDHDQFNKIIGEAKLSDEQYGPSTQQTFSRLELTTAYSAMAANSAIQWPSGSPH